MGDESRKSVFECSPDLPTPPSPRMTHLKTRGPIRLFWDLLVVKEAEIMSLLDELPQLPADFFVFFFPFAEEMSDDIFGLQDF